MSAIQWWGRTFLFFGTVSPLLALQGILTLTDKPTLGTPLIAAGVVLFLAPLLLFPVTRKRIQTTPFILEETQAATPNLGAFLLAYLLPILALSLTERTDVLLFLILVLLIGILYTRGNLIHVQPIYWITGWHVYECKKRTGEWVWVLTRQTLTPGDYRLRDLGGHVLADI